MFRLISMGIPLFLSINLLFLHYEGVFKKEHNNCSLLDCNNNPHIVYAGKDNAVCGTTVQYPLFSNSIYSNFNFF